MSQGDFRQRVGATLPRNMNQVELGKALEYLCRNARRRTDAR